MVRRMAADNTDRRSRRGRVVMLVDNGVLGDSRVQKTARSAADAGWDVVLLGIKGNTDTDSWRIGDAQVRLIPVRRSLGRHPTQFQRSLLRRPLAYPPGYQAGYRIQKIKAWQAAMYEQRVAWAVARAEGGSRLRELLGTGLQLPARATATLLARWAKFRAGSCPGCAATSRTRRTC
jgi:glycogen(starch) synthase